MPAVTVIVPNYNHARFLPQRLDSVLGQSYRDLEILLLDDASTDGSQALLRERASDPRVRLIFNTENSGSVFRQWNRGLAEATGEFVWIAESDDFASPHLLETLVPLLQAHPTAGLVVCESEWIDDRDAVIPRTVTSIAQAGGTPAGCLVRGATFVPKSLLLGCSIQNASAVVFRRAVAKDAGYADTRFRLAGDWMFWVSLLERSDALLVSTKLNAWRHHGGTVRAFARGAGFGSRETIRIARHILRRFETSPDLRRALRESLVCKVWQDVVGAPSTVGLSPRLAVLAEALRFQPTLAAGLVRFGLRRAVARWAGGRNATAPTSPS